MADGESGPSRLANLMKSHSALVKRIGPGSALAQLIESNRDVANAIDSDPALAELVILYEINVDTINSAIKKIDPIPDPPNIPRRDATQRLVKQYKESLEEAKKLIVNSSVSCRVWHEINKIEKTKAEEQKKKAETRQQRYEELLEFVEGLPSYREFTAEQVAKLEEIKQSDDGTIGERANYEDRMTNSKTALKQLQGENEDQRQRIDVLERQAKEMKEMLNTYFRRLVYHLLAYATSLMWVLAQLREVYQGPELTADEFRALYKRFLCLYRAWQPEDSNPPNPQDSSTQTGDGNFLDLGPGILPQPLVAGTTRDIDFLMRLSSGHLAKTVDVVAIHEDVLQEVKEMSPEDLWGMLAEDPPKLKFRIFEEETETETETEETETEETGS